MRTDLALEELRGLKTWYRGYESIFGALIFRNHMATGCLNDVIHGHHLEHVATVGRKEDVRLAILRR
jgi:hypothetical protein